MRYYDYDSFDKIGEWLVLLFSTIVDLDGLLEFEKTYIFNLKKEIKLRKDWYLCRYFSNTSESCN